jgi:4-diphosphocytidyl-2-C-methyl-D-erythritol kinase
MLSVAVFSPAKINLFLAVTGRRPDGFHDLVSLVAPLAFGDSLWLSVGLEDGPVTLTCDDAAVPAGPENLAVRAAGAFRAATGWRRALAIALTKRIPMGAGLGGGSSNAAAVLRGLNAVCGRPLDRVALGELGATLGSDVPLFLENAPCIMRGRGERIEPLAAAARARFTGRRVLVFKPDFSISTPWAYGQLAAGAGGAAYTPPEEAEARLASALALDARPGELLFNSFEQVAFRKFVALPEVAEQLGREPGVEGVLLSGSGSACFALLAGAAQAGKLTAILRETLGDEAFVIETVLV